MSDTETQQNYTSKDVLSYALAKDAANLSTAFNNVVGAKVLDAIQQKKVELAKRMFNSDVEAEKEVEDTETVAASDNNQENVADTTDNGIEVTNSGEEENKDEIAQQNT